MTVEKCVAFAQTNSWVYAGVEFGGQCFVGNSTQDAAPAPQSDCTQVCAGSSTELCGNGNRIQIYQNRGGLVTIPTSTATSSASSAPPTAVPTVGAFTSQGCFYDSTTARVLVVDSATKSGATGMTVEMCTAMARSEGLRYAGVEDGVECWVGNTLHGAQQAPDRDCAMPCAGNAHEICGDGNRVLVYEDQSWADPSLDQLIAAVAAYNATIAQIQGLTQQYHDALAEWAAAQNTSQRRRATDPTQLRQRLTSTVNRLHTTLEEIELGMQSCQHDSCVGRFVVN